MIKIADFKICGTITEIKKDHLIVDVPSLGKREIYDLKNLIK